MIPMAQRSPEFIFFTPEARGGSYWYYGQAGADLFEVWADIAARYPLNPHRTAINGPSMGGYGTLKITSQYPDLFGRALPVIPCHWAFVGPAPANEPSEIFPMAASFRNVPIFAIYGDADDTCEWNVFEGIVGAWDQMGYRYLTHKYPGNHQGAYYNGWVQLPVIDVASDWLAQAVVNRNPAHVSYSMNAEMSQPDVGLNNNRAFWVSDIKVRNGQAFPPVGTIDVFSFGFGRTDPTVLATQHGTGVTPGQSPPWPFIFQSKEWGHAGTAREKNKLKITATNVSELTIQVDRAHVNCDAILDVQSDGPLKVTLTGRHADHDRSGCSREAFF
jgi:hypothetical protein